jgi:hypothetical protein
MAYLWFIERSGSLQAYGDGVMGGPHQVEEKILQEIFDTALKFTKGVLNFDRKRGIDDHVL